MKPNNLNIYVSYNQLVVFIHSTELPFSLWTDKHVSQGFAWRPESVSFRTLVDSGDHLIEIFITEYLGEIGSNVIRAIDLPFFIPESEQIEIASIADASLLNIPSGQYLLRCEFLENMNEDFERVRFTFASKEPPRFELIRADHELDANEDLLITASPAI